MRIVQLLILPLLIGLNWGVANAQSMVERKLDSFDELRVGQGITVYLKAGDSERVKIEYKNMDPDRLITEVSGSTLRISYAKGNYSNTQVKVYVTYKKLTEIDANSAASIYTENKIKGGSLEVHVSSAANVELDVEMNSFEAEVSSSGDLEVRGDAAKVGLFANSAGSIDAYDLKGEKVEVKASSAGSIKAFASNEINANASSGGSVRYKGTPQKSQANSSSGGSVRRVN